MKNQVSAPKFVKDCEYKIYYGKRVYRIKQAIYECYCGKIFKSVKNAVDAGSTISCGCYNKKYNQVQEIHGHSKDKTNGYKSWEGMKDRCINTKHHAYKDYGGRGITVCQNWLGENGFINFISDMGERPSKEHSLDRIDNNKGYCKENCRWATKKEQSRNQRSNILYLYNGESKTIPEWAEIYNIKKITLYQRVCSYNMSIKEAIEKPVRNYKLKKEKEE